MANHAHSLRLVIEDESGNLKIHMRHNVNACLCGKYCHVLNRFACWPLSGRLDVLRGSTSFPDYERCLNHIIASLDVAIVKSIVIKTRMHLEHGCYCQTFGHICFDNIEQLDVSQMCVECDLSNHIAAVCNVRELIVGCADLVLRNYADYMAVRKLSHVNGIWCLACAEKLCSVRNSHILDTSPPYEYLGKQININRANYYNTLTKLCLLTVYWHNINIDHLMPDLLSQYKDLYMVG